MTTDLLIFMKENWNLIVNNLWTFLLFGTFIFLIGFGISWKIHNYYLDVKLHNIPEREELQKQVSQLKEENANLQKQLERFNLKELIQETFHEKSENETIGDVIRRNVKSSNK